MRITNRMMIDNAITHMADNLAALNDASQKAGSGKAFQNASEDPVTAALTLNLHSSLSVSEAYKSTAQLTNDWMSATDNALQKISDTGITAINDVQQALNDTLGVTERKTLATEIGGILQNVAELGNSQSNGQYIFSGFQSDKPAFTVNPATFAATYQGDPKLMIRSLGPNQSVVMNVTGNAAIKPLLDSLKRVYDHLMNGSINTPLPPPSVDPSTLRTELTTLQSAVDAIGTQSTANGARQRQVLTAMDYLDKANIETQNLISQKENVNMAEAISNLRGQETTYQAVLEVSQRAISTANLFELMR